jgi:hypothetical protein
MRYIPTTFVLLSLLLLSGCATQKRNDSLTTTLNAYGSTVRWGDFQNAVMFIEPKQRLEHPLTQLDLDRFKQVRVSQYDEGTGPLPAGPDEVQQTVHIGLINVNRQTERSIVDHQTWHYDEVSKHWWLTSGLPDITQK